MLSWHLQLNQATQSAELQLRGFEEGSLTVAGQKFKISKQGFLSGKWHLLSQGQIIAQAHKPSSLTQRFLVSTSGKEYSLIPVGLGRSMELTGSETNLLIAPEHPFTRRSTIRGSGDDFLLASFSFWLTIMLWQRSQSMGVQISCSLTAPNIG